MERFDDLSLLFQLAAYITLHLPRIVAVFIEIY